MGKHTRNHSLRSHRKPSATRRAAASTATAALGTAAAGAIIVSAHHAPAVVQLPAAAPAAEVTVEAPSLHAISVRQSAWATVKSGQTLSGIASGNCNAEQDWTGIYKKNEKTIGADYNLIQPGQQLELDCRVVSIPAVTTASYAQPVHYRHHHQSVRPAVISAHVQGGNLSFGGLEALWVAAGGPAWAESAAASVAECESGGQQYAHNPSGASGYFQILGQVVAGDIYDPMVNARNAVAKFEASGSSWAQWVCKP